MAEGGAAVLAGTAGLLSDGRAAVGAATAIAAGVGVSLSISKSSDGGGGDGGGSEGATTVEDIVQEATRTVPDRLRKNRAAQYQKPGGIAEANADFDRLRPAGVVNKGEGIRVGKLPDGRTAVVRGRSLEGSPTLEIQGESEPIKIRFVGEEKS
jgi:hypothetical protein